MMDKSDAYLEYLISVASDELKIKFEFSDFGKEAVQLKGCEIDKSLLPGNTKLRDADVLTVYTFNADREGKLYLGYVLLNQNVSQPYMVGWLINGRLRWSHSFSEEV